MVIDMNESRLNTVAQLRAFLNGTLEVEFCPLSSDPQRYQFIGAVLTRFRYSQLRRADKGVVLRYLQRASGYSRQQLTRLVSRAVGGSPLSKRYRAPKRGFARKFTAADMALLAETDALHGTLSGPATKQLMQRAYGLYGDTRYQRLAAVSVSHLYNLRAQAGYRAKRVHWTKTKGHAVAIAQRRAPAPEGRPGFIRIDSVHQGDQDGCKGLYHINQRRRLPDPVRAGGQLPAHQRGLPAAGAAKSAARLSLLHLGLSRRQRLRVHQLHGGEDVEEASGGVH